MVNFASAASQQQQVSWLQMQYAVQQQQQQQAHTYLMAAAAANQIPFHNRPGPADCCLGNGTHCRKYAEYMRKIIAKQTPRGQAPHDPGCPKILNNHQAPFF
jgi:hypothetical protein